jgi:hypothetical protein
MELKTAPTWEVEGLVFLTGRGGSTPLSRIIQVSSATSKRNPTSSSGALRKEP